MSIQTNSAEETRKVAAVLAAELDKRAPHPLIIALDGDLGSGKTTFIQRLARALGIKRRLLSPTFLLMRSYPIPKPLAGYHKLYHLDAYRFKRAQETETIALQNVLCDSQNIILIEWAGNIKKALPKNSIWMKFEHGRRENERIISLRNTNYLRI